jgi:lysozyme
MANALVLDISHWQPEPDFAKLKANGTIGIIMKATEGTGYVDPTFYSRRTKAQKAGLAVSSYHFFKKGSVQAQMDHYLKTVEPGPNERLCIDHEEKASLAELEQAVNYLWSKGVRNITIYSGHLIKEQLGTSVNATLRDKTSLWIAHYTSAAKPTWPEKTWGVWSLWQYSDKGRAIGISGDVDVNKWNGNPAALAGWIDSDFATGTTPPPPQPESMEADIKAPVGVQVNISVNGKFVTSAIAK